MSAGNDKSPRLFPSHKVNWMWKNRDHRSPRRVPSTGDLDLRSEFTFGRNNIARWPKALIVGRRSAICRGILSQYLSNEGRPTFQTRVPFDGRFWPTTLAREAALIESSDKDLRSYLVVPTAIAINLSFSTRSECGQKVASSKCWNTSLRDWVSARVDDCHVSILRESTSLQRVFLWGFQLVDRWIQLVGFHSLWSTLISYIS